MTSPFQKTFSNSQVVEATGATSINIQNWIVRGWITGSRLPDGGGSQGKHRRFSFHNLMEIAAAKTLTNAGLSDLEDVFSAAAHFAHFGDMTGKPIRLPGLPYRDGKTLILAGPGGSKVIAVRPGQKALDLFVDLTARMGSAGLVSVPGGAWIDGSDLFCQTMTRAGFDPDAVMREAYGK